MPRKRGDGDGGLYFDRGKRLWTGVVITGYADTGKRTRKFVYSKSKATCRGKLDALKAEIALHGAPLDKSVTLADWAGRWLDEVARPNLSPKTYQSYASTTKQWIVPTIGRKKIAALKPSDVRAVRTAITGAGKSLSLARTAHTALARMLDDARINGLCARNVADDVKRPPAGRARNLAKTRPALTMTQAVAVLEAASKRRDGARWWFKMLTGQRQTEILGARLVDLDLDAAETDNGEAVGTYQVNWRLGELNRRHGCGEKTGGAWPCGRKRGCDCTSPEWEVPDEYDMIQVRGRWHLVAPKSRRGRVVPLIPPLVEALRRQLDTTQAQPNPAGLIWHHDDGTPITPHEDAQQWRELLLAAGLITPEEAVPGGTELTGHVARHTVVTILASLGVDLQLIGEIVGHSSVQVTEIYRHAQIEEKRLAAEKLGKAFAGGLLLPSV